MLDFCGILRVNQFFCMLSQTCGLSSARIVSSSCPVSLRRTSALGQWFCESVLCLWERFKDTFQDDQHLAVPLQEHPYIYTRPVTVRSSQPALHSPAPSLAPVLLLVALARPGFM